MSRIFLSHSSLDSRQALALRQWLIEQDPSLQNEIFLDLHPEAGIHPGQQWMDALRAASTRCEAVICLLSANWEASAFCKAEYYLAELLSKKVFSARIDLSVGTDPTRTWQQIDLFGQGAATSIDIGDGEEPVAFLSDGLSRLHTGIAKAGIGAQSFPWPPPRDQERSPYRGWDPLDEADAAVFFSRDAQIIGGLDALRRMRVTGETLFVVLGPSGAGKSSFLRAGLLPRLRREDRDFVVLDIVRPQTAVLTGPTGFATAVHTTRDRFSLAGPTQGDIELACRDGDYAQVHTWLRDVQREARKRLVDDDEELRLPTLVLPIDQAEELVGADAGNESKQFLELLSALARPAGDVGDARDDRLKLIVALTIRADRYQDFHDADELENVHSVVFTDLKPMQRTLFKDVITGPAERATRSGRPLEIETTLVNQLLEDCTEGADTLPLLALTLSLLFTKYRRVPVADPTNPGEKGSGTPQLTLADYEKMGGISGVVQTEIDSLLSAEPTQRAGELAILRTAFIPWLATINPTNDQPLRRIARWTDLPADSHPLLERFITRRLLVRSVPGNDGVPDGDTVPEVEVALESLLRQWKELAAWLDEQREDLKQADTIESANTAWLHGNSDDWLLSGGRLADAEALLITPGFRERLAYTTDFVKASRLKENERADALKQQQEKELRDAEAHAAALNRRSKILRGVLVATAIVAVLAVVGALVAANQTRKADAATHDAFLRYVEATATRLDAEGIAILSDNHAGTDARAYQEILAAYALQAKYPEGSKSPVAPENGPLLDALVKRYTTVKMIDAGGVVALMAMNPAGDRIATNVNGNVRIWDVDTGQPIGDPIPSDPGVTYSGIAFSPDGTRLAANSSSLGETGKIRMFDVKTHDLVRTFTGPKEDSLRPTFSADGHRIAAGYANGTAVVWNVDTGDTELTLSGFHHGAVNSVAFSPPEAPGEPLIATGSDDRSIQLWDAHTGAHVRSLTHESQWQVTSVAFSPDGLEIAAGDLNVGIFLWAPDTGVMLAPMLDSGAVKSVAWNPTVFNLASAGASGTVRVWHFPADQVPWNNPLPGHLGNTGDVAYSADGSRIAAGGTNGIVQVWSPALDDRADTETLVSGIAFSRDGQRVGVAGDDGDVQLWDVRAVPRYLPNPLVGHRGKLTGVAFDPTDPLVAAGAEDGTVILWDPARSEPVRTLPGNVRVRDIAFSRDGALLASASGKTVKLWNPRTGTPARPELSGPTDDVSSVAFSPVQNLVAAASFDKKIYVWDAGSGHIQHVIDAQAAVGPVAFSPDGRRLVSGADDNLVRVWDLDHEKLAMDPLVGHTGRLNAVAYTPDGRFIASGSDDGNTRLWDAATGQAVGSPLAQPPSDLPEIPSSVTSIAFSPDGRKMATGSVGRNFRLWPGSPMPADLCGKLNANPTKKQWETWVAPDIDYIKVCPDLPPPSDKG